MPKTPEQTAGEMKLYRNRSALMQGLVLQVSRGYVYYVAGQVPASKALRVAAKFHQNYGALASPQARQAARRRGRDQPISRLFMHPADDGVSYDWWILAPRPLQGETMLDARDRRQRIKVAERYEIVLRPRPGSPKAWTWQLVRDEKEALEAAVERDAKRRDAYAIQELISRLTNMPMFSGVRSDVAALIRLADQTWKRHHRGAATYVQRLIRGSGRANTLTLPRELPVMRRISSYDDPPTTLAQDVRHRLDR